MQTIAGNWNTRVRDAVGGVASPGVFIMAAVLLVLGFYLLYPIFLVFMMSFNIAVHPFLGEEWGLEHWRVAFTQPGILRAIGNSFMIWGLTMVISLPTAVLISWSLARTRIPWSNGLEFMFWVSYMIPTLATTIGWITLLDPRIGILNQALAGLSFIDKYPFNIFSVPGIVWANLMGNGIALKVMLLTPAFRNMDAALEEAARVSGASNLRTMFRVTLPLMITPIALVFALQLLRIFQSFETELLLGTPFGFYNYATMIYQLIRVAEDDIPKYGQATVLASLTIVIIAVIIPLQRWILRRRQYTTISATFKPGLIDLGLWKYPVVFGMWSLVFLLTLVPVASLVWGSFMTRAGMFMLTPVYTLDHWTTVFGDPSFLQAMKTTLALGIMAAIFSPLLFSMLAYILVRTTWPGRGILDSIIWSSGAIPGMLSSLGLLILFLDTPVLSLLYGTIWALVIVVIISGKVTGVNIMKGTLIQVGAEMEEAARISGAGWTRTYMRIWIPLQMRTLMLLATINFVSAAGATSSVILLADRESQPLSLLALFYRLAGDQEAASIVSIILLFLTVGLASLMWAFGLRLGVRHQ
jgi:iron(III) transport system permease protein